MPFADTVTGARLYYDDRGANARGETILLLPGLMGTAEAHFVPLMNWLDPYFRVIGLTLRGFGASEPKPRTFPPDFYHRDARDVLAFMEAIGVERAHLFGYSDGGEAALAAAGMAPDRFLSVMTVGAVGYFGPAMRPIAQNLYPGAWINDEERERNGITDPASFILGWITSVKHMIDAGGDVSVGMADRITVPLLLMLGEADTLNPREYGQRFVDRTAQGRLAMFPVGHDVHDKDWDGFRREVGAFLRIAP